MISTYDRKIILEDGQEYYGCSFGGDREEILEIVFNTSMVGYQEIVSDPSYTDQAVVMTWPLIGNYGMAVDDYETERPSIRRAAAQKNITMLTSLDTVRMILDVLEEMTLGVSTVDAE